MLRIVYKEFNNIPSILPILARNAGSTTSGGFTSPNTENGTNYGKNTNNDLALHNTATGYANKSVKDLLRALFVLRFSSSDFLIKHHETVRKQFII